ncbi:MAG TPA: nucleoside triphosphate pyrophosphohydrolase [Candidatus Sumerlaeota bacterium]|nr:nucleoside triphosphate pyrophosphohydrolase [Candidatus Sumerlaeota bacterium]HON49341.1 nucleoside triphosphate pyrophosphohydrolase [Candidatus Sumerlaeota bacterium]HOR64911.1 nucleoside triphosphate pyrophosphohydrolase [Candidatus Sumerlaeota bacterium]HPL73064.1 nucleoside triphosphate pyrophosphohydrolase [Candidatus Sumerlaeota bacterium]HRU52900.1 nucleoside triphosphate pyrophosphohydrolase [Candidatus Sumerlaeia bacterium]
MQSNQNAFERLIDIMKRLIEPGGCPWDREQTHESLKPYLIEESYEVCEAIDRGDFDDLKEELGDVALQIVFHAELARRAGRFDIHDVLNGICNKLVSRHPHVFSNGGAKTSTEVLARWEEIKKVEKSAKKKDRKPSVLDGIPREMPALAYACRIQERAANVGFDWDKTEDVRAKVIEEWQELEEALKSGDAEMIDEEFGDLLFAIVNYSRFAGINPEQSLRKTIMKFQDRFRHIEKRAEEQAKKISEMSLSEMDVFWNEAKKM